VLALNRDVQVGNNSRTGWAGNANIPKKSEADVDKEVCTASSHGVDAGRRDCPRLLVNLVLGTQTRDNFGYAGFLRMIVMITRRMADAAPILSDIV
jgi:hypothetical protein